MPPGAEEIGRLGTYAEKTQSRQPTISKTSAADEEAGTAWCADGTETAEASTQTLMIMKDKNDFDNILNKLRNEFRGKKPVAS